MIKGFFTHHFGKENMKKIEALGVEITYIPERTVEDNTKVEDYDFMVCYDSFPKLRLQGNRLKWIQLTSKGIAHVPEEIRENYLITNNKNASAIPIAETIMGYIFYFYKNFPIFNQNKTKKLWKPKTDMLELTGKTILFLGTGEIAKETVKKLAPHEVTILGINTEGRATEGFSEVFPLSHLERCLERADISISTLPDTKDTKHILNEESLSHTKEGSVLINISRGAILKEAALISFLEKDHFRGVALDVFEEEPLPETSPLWDFDRLLITPHSSFFSDYYKERLFQMIYKNIKHFLNKEPLDNMVDYKKGY